MALNVTTASSFLPAGMGAIKPFERANLVMIHKGRNIENAYRTMSVTIRPSN
jgi:hypothetical protein